MSNNSLSKILYWDGKADGFRVYVSKIEAYAEFVGIGDALVPVLMGNCPTWLDLDENDAMNPDNQNPVGLYKANKK